MESIYIKEEKDYSFNDLHKFFALNDEDKTKNLINKLKNKHILVSVNKSTNNKDLSEINWLEVDEEEANSREKTYKFNYVGLLYINNMLLKCYPKYYSNEPELSEYKQVLKVIDRYKNKNSLQINNTIDSQYKKDFNELELCLYLINDYLSNGLYINQQWVIKKNVNGEIDWNRTINKTTPIIQDGNPVYVELYNRKKVDNNKEFITILHKAIITEISNEFKHNDINTLFDLDDISLSDDSVRDLGDTNYILYKIERELCQQFNSEKQLLLKCMHTYVSKSETQNKDNDLKMYGTNSMNLVWEDVCKQVLGDNLDSKVSSIITIPNEYNNNHTLKDIIEKPKWTFTNKEADDTLIPDMVIIKDDSMFIVDAKYYTPIIEIDKLERQPGIDSIIKQFMYQLAYKDFCNEHDIDFKGNYFILPTESKEVIYKGEVSMQMMTDIGLNDIKVRCMPATEFYEYYLKNQSFDINKLQ